MATLPPLMTRDRITSHSPSPCRTITSDGRTQAKTLFYILCLRPAKLFSCVLFSKLPFLIAHSFQFVHVDRVLLTIVHSLRLILTVSIRFSVYNLFRCEARLVVTPLHPPIPPCTFRNIFLPWLFQPFSLRLPSMPRSPAKKRQSERFQRHRL